MEADLRRFYQVKLADVWAGKECVLHVANLVEFMPRGAAIYEWFGGASALTGEQQALWELQEITIRAHAEKPNKVKPRKLPEGLRNQRERERILSSQAERWRQRQEQRKRSGS